MELRHNDVGSHTAPPQPLCGILCLCSVKGRQPNKRGCFCSLRSLSTNNWNIYLYVFSLINVAWYILMEGDKIFNAGKDTYKSQWKVEGSKWMLCAFMWSSTLQFICFVFMCVSCTRRVKSVMHAIDNLKMYQLSSDIPTKHLGCWPRGGALVWEATQGLLAVKISEHFLSPVPMPGHNSCLVLIYLWS